MEEKKTVKKEEVKEEKVVKKDDVEKVSTKETKKEEVKTEEKAPVKEEKKEVKPKVKKDKDEKSIVSRVINIALWIILIVWMIIVFSDFVKVKNEEEPKFCWGEKTTTYDDGTVVECKGLGYKVINYKRSSFKAIEFGPFWIKDRSADNK